MPTVVLRRWTGQVKDARRVTVDSYATPVPLDCTIAPKSTDETARAGYDNRVIDQLTLLDVSETISPRDLVDIDGTSYQVNGKPFDWAANDPFGPVGGLQIDLIAVTAP